MNKEIGCGVAIIIPCYNEGETIHKVVSGFKEALPDAIVYVYDNCSTDNTQEQAKNAGAIVRIEKRQGKGNVIRTMFADVNADYYVLVDGDLTYDPKVAPEMIKHLIDNNLDMLNISRDGVAGAYRRGHKIGNFLLTKTVEVIFGSGLSDMLSGYRVFTNRFVKTFPAKSNGFEVETELTVHSLEMKLPIGELSAKYDDRPDGSVSKLSTYRDGVKILLMITRLFFLVKPLISFSILSGVLAISAIIIGWVQVVSPLLEYGVITKYPSVILSSSLMVLSILLFISGVIINAISNTRKDYFRLLYLSK
jgi:glycosyltransferase involved in cell wall biosynthesis